MEQDRSSSARGAGRSARDSAPAVAARPAASLLLARDGSEGPELFLLARSRESAFASGALVYPGGVVDETDRNPALRARTDGADGLGDDDLAFRIAAIREAFEECGLLLARDRGSSDLLGRGRVDAIQRRFAGALADHRLDMLALAEAEDLVFAGDRLVPFAHWITPETQPKRFDTHFFLAGAPPGQEAGHDGHESTASVWITPAALVEAADAGKWYVMFPTRLNAQKFGRSATVADALSAARAAPVVTVMPRGQKVEGGRKLRIPAGAGYGLTEALVDKRGAVTRIG